MGTIAKNCEIIDGYGRPLCYDKVKTNQPLYWQFDRFQRKSSAVPSNPGSGDGKGPNVHPDWEYLTNGIPLNPQWEPEFIELNIPSDGAAAHNFLLARWADPRLRDPAEMESVATGLDSGGDLGDASDGIVSVTNGSHVPKNVGGYDLWSAGRSLVDPRDDITSWGE